MMKRYLLAPGPTPIPEEVLLAMARPILHHRSKDFLPIFEEVRSGLKWLFQTKSEVLVFAASGTGAMEAAVVNTLSPGDRALVVRAGKFGERWGEICAAYGVAATLIDVPWGQAVRPEQVEEALRKDPGLKAVFLQATETSTGVVHPVREIADLVRPRDGTLLAVDGITGVGVFDLPADAWGIDLLIGGSQKALMLPPGLAFTSVSDKAWKAVETSKLPKFYFSFKKELKNLLKNQSAYTPAISLLIGLRESLKLLREEGLPAIFARHALLADATRAAVRALGLELYASPPSNAVTAVKAPPGIDGQKVYDTLRSRYGVTIAGGQDAAKGKIFRIAHLGYFDRFDVTTAVSALEMTLKDLGHPVELGRGVRAAEEVFARASKAA